jgi:hypothetical protein
LAFNKDHFTITFRQRWADFHALAPATSYSDSWFPHARALFASFGLSSYFDECRQIEYGRLCLAPSSNMEPPMSLLNVARGLPTRPLLLHPVASVRKQ